jgi:hypothetical protein
MSQEYIITPNEINKIKSWFDKNIGVDYEITGDKHFDDFLSFVVFDIEEDEHYMFMGFLKKNNYLSSL